MMAVACITALHVYPVKSCGGIALTRAQLLATGLEHDRRWLVTDPNGRFQTQRELPAMSLIFTAVQGSWLRLSAPGLPDVEVAAARWLSRHLGRALRLVRFDVSAARDCERGWLGDAQATTMFADAYPLLLISEASLEDLNARLPRPLPMNRFRPNIVLGGLGAYDEDRIVELHGEGIALRLVKPCTRCAITTTEQSRGERDGEEPLRTLKSYRWDKSLRGVTFGQNAIVVSGAGRWLQVGQELQIKGA
jgi:uncharacterized protein YcbX